MLTVANGVKSALLTVIRFGAVRFALAPEPEVVNVCPLASSKMPSPEFSERYCA